MEASGCRIASIPSTPAVRRCLTRVFPYGITGKFADGQNGPFVRGIRFHRADRAVDSTGATIDFLLSAKRDAAAAERFLAKALRGANHPHPRVINTDKDAAYPPAIVQLKAKGFLEENCGHRPAQYLNNVLEQDHRAIKRRPGPRESAFTTKSQQSRARKAVDFRSFAVVH